MFYNKNNINKNFVSTIITSLTNLEKQDIFICRYTFEYKLSCFDFHLDVFIITILVELYKYILLNIIFKNTIIYRSYFMLYS